jgi:hypothetical protein
MTCKSGAQTLDGGKSSSSKMINSSTSPTEEFWMLKEAKMLKETQFNYGAITEVKLKSGQFSMLTKLIKLRLRDLMKNLVFTSTDHSTLYPNFHSTE